MNQDSKENLWLVDHLHKCRCCFERFDHNENQFKITEIIEEQFLELTQIELKPSPNFSNTICSKCASELQSISNFRLNLITKQQQLYDFVITSPYKIQDDIKFESVNIKIETQTSDEINSMFQFGASFEEIKIPDLPVISIIAEAKATRKSPRQLKVQTYIQKKTKTMVKTKGQIKTQSEVQQVNGKRTCPECGLILGAYKLSKHIRRVHLKIKHFFCDLCGFGDIYKRGLIQHIQTHTIREKLYCDQCKFETISIQSMKLHLSNDHGTKAKKIDQISECYCGKVFPSIKKLKCHKRNTHFKSHICTICSKAFPESYQLKKHMQNHSGIKQVKKKRILNIQMCPHCGLFLKCAGTLSKHIRRVHLKQKYFFCDYCGSGYIFKSLLIQHMYTHTMREKLCCNKCKFETISIQSMKLHLSNDHGTKAKKIDQISECYCGKVFPSIKKLKCHKRNTHFKSHICTICSKAFPAPSLLKKHFMIKHSGIDRKREKGCDVCGKMFETLNQLRRHMIQHKDPELICSFDGCTKKFFTPVTLEYHKKTHIDQRDFACQLCDKKYFASNHLSRHVKHFHRQLKVSCELPGCTSKFARKETYRNHVLSHHKDLSQKKVQALLKKIRELKQE